MTIRYKSIVRSFYQPLLVSMLMLWMYGCASSSATLEIKKPVSGSLSEYRVVAVEVPADSRKTGNPEVIDELVGSVVANLREAGAFQKVYSRSATLVKNFDLIISLVPTAVLDTEIGQAWFGILAGSSTMSIDVQLINGQSGEVLGVATIEGTSAHKTTIFTSSSMAQAIERISEKIASYVVQSI